MNHTEFAVLSLIVEKARHGYEIERVIEERGMREWADIGFSSIYYLLNKLEKKELVASNIEQQAGRGPARKVYHITENGRQACRDATLSALSTPHRCNKPLLFGLANLPSVSAVEALIATRKHQNGLLEHLSQLQNRREAQRPLPDFVEAMFDYSLTMLHAEIEWLKKLSDQLEGNNV